MQPMIKNIAQFIDHLGGDINMRRDRPFNGQPHTDNGVRGSQEISGVTMRDIKDAFIRAYIISHLCYENDSNKPIEPNHTLIKECGKGPDACICENDVYTLKGDIDPMAVAQNLTCEIERLMGIFPNLPGYKKVGYGEEPIKLSDLNDDFPKFDWM